MEKCSNTKQWLPQSLKKKVLMIWSEKKQEKFKK